MTRWMMSLALIAGCKTGAIEVDTDDTDVVVDTNVPAPPNPFAGDYEGSVNLMNESWGFRHCQGDAFEIEIDDDGELTGEGVCIGQTWGGGEQPYDVEIAGQVDPVTGALTDATVTFQIMGGGGGGGELIDVEADVVGNADNADVEADWEVEVEGGGGGGSTTYSGEINTWPN